MRDPAVTATQRAYLTALDQWLRNPTARRTLERQKRLGAVCAEAGIRPGDEPEQREATSRMSDQPRPTKVVLAEALAELQAREAKLQRLERELAENRAAIKVLRKLVGDAPARLAPTPPTPVAPVQPPAPVSAPRLSNDERDALTLQIIGEQQPCARATLLERTGLTPNVLTATLGRLRAADKIQMVGQKTLARYVLAANQERSAA